MEKLVSIIILNWNGMKFTKPCIDSIKKNTKHKRYEIIMVDNGSNGKEILELKAMKGSDLIKELILNSENRGFSGANNQGMAIAKGDYFMLLNNDTIVKPGWLKGLVEVAESDERIGILQPDLPESMDEKQDYCGGYIDSRGTARLTRKEPNAFFQELEQASGAAFLIKRSAFERLGFLDEGFNPIYFEESDYCARARKAGFKVGYTSKSRVIHLVSKCTTGQASRWQYVTVNKNRLRYVLLHFGKAGLLKALFWEALRFIKSIFGRKAHWMLAAYWANAKNLREIIVKRKSYARGNFLLGNG
ncbi:MAG: glycosyltransferase family 2 protein [Candidatus Diapherotrites archaeon]|uniref:Glycosyltransferase family 2 protein n=1 Tax=Candidatus Iainarchaeum sp. TaxID=3101447 RepID=A0A938YP36_9ARCH|nr:glycosyltransferase family 2 protein [Candidatus Diapherotrites archaeon]